MGTKFGAKLEIKGADGRTTVVNPTMELGSQGPIQHPEAIDDKNAVAMLGMDAGSKSVTVQFETASTMFPVEVFQKPFVGFVWSGAGIMTLGGLLAAYYRRRVPVLETSQESRKKRQPAGGKVFVKSHGGQ